MATVCPVHHCVLGTWDCFLCYRKYVVKHVELSYLFPPLLPTFQVRSLRLTHLADLSALRKREEPYQNYHPVSRRLWAASSTYASLFLLFLEIVILTPVLALPRLPGLRPSWMLEVGIPYWAILHIGTHSHTGAHEGLTIASEILTSPVSPL